MFLVASLAVGAAAAHSATNVFLDNFDAALPAQVDAGSALLTGVQGFGGLGPAGNTFSGKFLRSATGNLVSLTLTGLPTHSTISVAFLFAAIDSLDGTGSFPSGDYFRVTLDGQQIFRESFANATPSQFQSYVPAPGVELARHADLGFSGPGSFYTDSAYDFGAEPAFANLAHTASSATFTFQIEGQGIQDLNDESWAMDNLRVSVSAVPEPATVALWLAGLGLLGMQTRKARAGRGLPPS
jgi:hypothetical protein